MKGLTLEKRALLAAAVLLLALFPGLLSVVTPVSEILGWVVAQPLIAGIAVGAILFARRSRSVRPAQVPVQSQQVSAESMGVAA
ncbi:hypothetical protein OIC43_31055 [Streptomyces sp. NBC_00825]|uniref:hypothetical protein n=1 Tax=unclassified Streptomyces TaxID=2593676 RepID=UPI002ED0AFB3|nr:hypothetical protein OG832_12630 [Streptomyces sp. NBC_00826]WTH93154.1 hypothetical protein OIC43_31055 [Streptomyces sp. NBC_00825]WTI01886.1 hypothetical protein OHA23_31035 [Streptomyces sp. NBC_00822]